VLHGSFANVNVIGLALSSSCNDNSASASPGAFIRSLGEAYRASERGAPSWTQSRITRTAQMLPSARGASTSARRRSPRRLEQADINLFLAFNSTGQKIPGQGSVRIWYAESGFQTAVDPRRPLSTTAARM